MKSSWDTEYIKLNKSAGGDFRKLWTEFLSGGMAPAPYHRIVHGQNGHSCQHLCCFRGTHSGNVLISTRFHFEGSKNGGAHSVQWKLQSLRYGLNPYAANDRGYF